MLVPEDVSIPVMTTCQGTLVKMPASLDTTSSQSTGQPVPVQYNLRLEEPRNGVGTEPAQVQEIPIHNLLGQRVRFEHTGVYHCILCGRPVKRLFGEGMCFPCLQNAPEAAECIVRPELCQGHLGVGRDPDWEEAHHNQPHVVYFAVSSDLKVGVTRETQVPTRWIDQGAAWAVVLARVPYRQLAGRIEVALKELYTDRTVWQRMLKDTPPAVDIDINRELTRVRQHLHSVPECQDLLPYIVEQGDLKPLRLAYPIKETPQKVRSVSLARDHSVESTLTGIRGQYLLFDGGAVMNIRRHSGFHVSCILGD